MRAPSEIPLQIMEKSDPSVKNLQSDPAFTGLLDKLLPSTKSPLEFFLYTKKGLIAAHFDWIEILTGYSGKAIMGTSLFDLVKPEYKCSRVRDFRRSFFPKKTSARIWGFLSFNPNPEKRTRFNHDSTIYKDGMPINGYAENFGSFFGFFFLNMDFFQDRNHGRISQDLLITLAENGRILMHSLSFKKVLLAAAKERITVKDFSPSKGWNLLLKQEKLNKKYLFKAARENPASWKKVFNLSPSTIDQLELPKGWHYRSGILTKSNEDLSSFCKLVPEFDQEGQDVKVEMTLDSIMEIRIGVSFFASPHPESDTSPDWDGYLMIFSQGVLNDKVSVVIKRKSEFLHNFVCPGIIRPKGSSHFVFEKSGGYFSLNVNGENVLAEADSALLKREHQKKIALLGGYKFKISRLAIYARPTLLDRKKLLPSTQEVVFKGLPTRTFEGRILSGRLHEKKVWQIYLKDITHQKRLEKQVQNYVSAINVDLEVAEQIQNQLIELPAKKDKRLALAYIYEPSKKVGGDMVMVRKLDKDRYSFLVFDVAGHGIASALMCSLAKMSFNHAFENLRSPAKIAEKVKQDLNSVTHYTNFISAFIAIIDFKTLSLTYTPAR